MTDLIRTLPTRLIPLIQDFVLQYTEVGSRHGYAVEDLERRMALLIERAEWLLDHPVPFTPLHEAVREPFDYLQFGLDFFEPLVDWQRSCSTGDWRAVETGARAGENTILLANHQTEADPQLMHLMLRSSHQELATSMRFLAGERVQKDPIAAPFCLGRDLVCVYSRRHLDHPPELRSEKLTHNASAMRQLKELLAQGGVTLYLAPSGGRDRIGPSGEIELASFDPDAIEMMRLMAEGCGRTTWCRPLALATYSVLPPPADVHRPLGEVRCTEGGAIGMALGEPIDWSSLASGKEHRLTRSQAVQASVGNLYENLLNHLKPSK
jgi:glycerol-3-phosphate O-acyltransferase